MTHVRNPALAIRPVHPSQLPLIAIAGAAHHERHANRMVSAAIETWKQEGDFDFSKGLPLDPNEFSLHIRSFFWEAFAATDMILQWANEVLALGLDQTQVRWDDIRKRKSKEHRELWPKVLAALTTYRESGDFFELSTYRHLSHANFLVSQSLLSRDRKTSLVALEAARVGQAIEDIRDQLPRYLASISAHTKHVSELVQANTTAA